ncbi:hypothetical protein [Tichowtungia aerotolerans]|uniref:Uncharacterized protein n=1 Tax=Tichowtungia aerotolerans TaxID=2697043 RepID=A0A6P1MCS7_9BACT|nr:hypothetical protein [Tichowtungia aerotolerans]QHI69868.1 hypothetical protein GT409_10525 [Tichowtungia aerotolerans]
MNSLHSLESGTVSVTNTQKHASWVPVAVLFRFDAPVTGTVTITRTTGETVFQLATVELADNQSAAWIPETDYRFHINDVFTVTSTATNGTVEIIRKAAQ